MNPDGIQELLNAPMPGEFNAVNYVGRHIENTTMPQEGSCLTNMRHKSVRIHLKAQKKNEVKLEHLAELLPELPHEGWSYHVISKGNFDFWTYVPHLVKLAGRFDEFYCSTWTMSRNVATEMLNLFDRGLLGSISLMTGTYFKRRETAVYALILDGLIQRNQRYVAFANHAKIMLLQNENVNLVVEGSANLTASPRAENFILSNNHDLYDFHRSWMEEMYHVSN